MLTTRSPSDQLSRYRDSNNLARSLSITTERREVVPLAQESGLSIVILNLDKPELIVPLLASLSESQDLFARRRQGFQVIVGDTGSTDPTVRELYQHLPAFVELVPGLTYHFSRSNNDCAHERVRHHRILFLNNDVVFESPEQVWAMYEASFGARVGIVGLALDYPDGSVQHIGIDVIRSGGRRGFVFHPSIGELAAHRPGNSWPSIATTGACLMIDTVLWQRLGGFDEEYSRECQDVDMCLAARRAGREVLIADVGAVTHLENATRGEGEEFGPDRRLLMRRWESFLEASYL